MAGHSHRERQWRADHGGIVSTVGRATGWMFFGLFGSYFAEFLALAMRQAITYNALWQARSSCLRRKASFGGYCSAKVQQNEMKRRELQDGWKEIFLVRAPRARISSVRSPAAYRRRSVASDEYFSSLLCLIRFHSSNHAQKQGHRIAMSKPPLIPNDCSRPRPKL